MSKTIYLFIIHNFDLISVDFLFDYLIFHQLIPFKQNFKNKTSVFQFNVWFCYYFFFHFFLSVIFSISVFLFVSFSLSLVSYPCVYLLDTATKWGEGRTVFIFAYMKMYAMLVLDVLICTYIFLFRLPALNARYKYYIKVYRF